MTPPTAIALTLVRWYQRHITRYTRPCRRLAGGPSCSQRMADALIRHGLLTAVLVAAPQVWLCCGSTKSSGGGPNSHGTSRYGCMEPSHHRHR